VGVNGTPKLLPSQPVEVAWPSGKIPKPEWNWWDPEANELATQWRTTPVTIDWNKDGLIDLVMLDHEGYLAYFERFMDNKTLKLKPGKRIFYSYPESSDVSKKESNLSRPLQLNSGKNGKSGRRKWTFADWDIDGDLDIIVNSENVSWYENVGTKSGIVEFDFKGNLSEQKLAGHTTSPTMVDWDKDGVPDLLLGAEDGHFYYLRNEREK
jgi:hypothetical protein